jgi:perosamine synthetase
MGNLKKKIYYTKPSITDLEIKYAADAAANGWGEKCYAYIDRFEESFKKHLGTKYAISSSSCTGALHMGMSALNIGLGDEVILADTNWIATVSPIVHLGAKPIFVDILKDTWCIDPDKVEAAITHRTKAIVAAHLYGNVCEMDRLLEIGRKYNIPIIEDAAEAIGSIYKGSKAGSMGKFGAFSFHGSKTITTGEGGMFVTNDKQFYERVLTLSNHGRAKNQKKQFWADMIGFKYKLSNLQAAIGCAQMERLNELIQKKQEILSKYKQQLEILNVVKMNPEPKGIINGAWMPTVVFDESTGVSREKIKASFDKENIDARVFFWPLSSLPMFDDSTQNVIARSVSSRAINLPSFHEITNDEIDRICQIIKKEVEVNL